MKRSSAFIVGTILALLPCIAAAQTVSANTSPLLPQLQALETEVASLEATLEALIGAVTGATPPAALASDSATDTPMSLPITAPQISSTVNDTYSGDITSQLMQALAPTASASTTFIISTPAISDSASQESGAATLPADIANQMDPACISSIFASGTQCGGLYWCGSGTNGYWSGQQCAATQ